MTTSDSIATPGLWLGPIVEFDSNGAAWALHIKERLMREILADGRSASYFVSAYLACHGFSRRPDGASGFLLGTVERDYRLRIGTRDLDLSPSNTKGTGREFTQERMLVELNKVDGFAVVFVEEFPCAKTWLMERAFVEKVLIPQGILDEKFNGSSARVRSFMESWITL